jgi:hypothetical protein
MAILTTCSTAVTAADTIGLWMTLGNAGWTGRCLPSSAVTSSRRSATRGGSRLPKCKELAGMLGIGGR